MPNNSPTTTRGPSLQHEEPASDLLDEAAVQEIIAESEKTLHQVTSDVSDSFAQYLHSLQRYPVLAPEVEQRLAIQAQRGSEEASNALVRHNLRFVITIAREYIASGVSLEDLVQEGNIGLLRAAARFHPEFGVRFITYAVFWIRQAIRVALACQQHPVRLPTGRAAQLAQVRRASLTLTAQHGRRPTMDEVSLETGVPVSMIETLLQASRGRLSLETTWSVGGNQALPLVERLAHHADVEGVFSLRHREEEVGKALDRLRERDARVLRLFFGIGGSREHTLEEIGHLLGVTRERVRQIRDRALRELRTSNIDSLRD